MKALVFDRPNAMAISEIARAEPSGDELLIRLRASGICGTDVHIWAGGFPVVFPLIPGHEFAGEVVTTGPECRRFKAGDRVAVEPNVPCNNCPECLRGEHHYCRNMVVPGVNRPGGLAEYVVVNERGAFDIGTLPFEYGALVEPLSCVVHAAERLCPNLADRVLIMGAGPIGILMGRVLRARGAAQVDYLEKNSERCAYVASLKMGAVYESPSAIPDAAYECVADASGASVLVAEAANRITRPRGKVLIFGVPAPEARVELNHFRVYRQEIQIIASFTSLKNSQQAIDLMRHGVVRVDDIISHTIKLSETPDYIHRMKSGDGSLRKVVVTDFSA